MLLLVISTLATLIGTASAVLMLGLRRSVDVITAWITVFAGQITALVLLMGAGFQLLRPGPLAGAAVLVAAAEVAPLVLSERRRTQARESVARVMHWNVKALRRCIRHPFLIVLVLAAALVYGWRLYIVYRLPLYDWDGLWYHLTAVDTWVQHGAIVHTPQILWADVYPEDGESISAWSVTFLHDVHFAGLTSFLFTLLGAASVTGLARGAGVRPSLAAMAGLIFLTLPIIVIQSGMMYVDIMANTTVLAAFQFLLSAADLPRRPRLAAEAARPQLIYCFLLAGIALGLAVGSKSTNLLSAFLGGLVAIVAIVLVRRRVKDERSLIRFGALPMAVLIVPTLALSMYWYVRTYLEYGDPFYPVSELGFTGLGNTYQEVVATQIPDALKPYSSKYVQALVSWSWDLHKQPWYYDQRMGGFGPQWPTLLAPSIVVASVAFFKKRRVFLVCLVLPFLIMVIVTPMPWWSRFTMFLAGLGAVCLVYVLQWIGRRWVTYTVASGLAVAALIGLWWSNDPTVIWDSNTQHISLSDVRQDAHLGYTKGGDRIHPWFAYTQLNAVPAGSTIAFTTVDQPFLLHPYIGNDLQRHVVLINGSSDPDVLLAQLSAAGADYVMIDTNLVVPVNQQPGIPVTPQGVSEVRSLALAMQTDSRFVPVATTFDGTVFKVVGTSAGSA